MQVVCNYGAILGIGFFVLVGASSATALPGQSIDEVASWMQANPTVRPRRGEKLLVRKQDSAAQSFSFQASLLPPGKITALANGGIVRSEVLTLFDVRNGVTFDRLRASLRNIYGATLSQDYDRAQVIYTYPTANTIQHEVNRADPHRAALQGELRQSDRYAYWLEVAQTSEGRATSGRLTVLLRDDVEKLAAELRNKE
ncbi:hypothetical protein [Myxacorys almedinensis]|uniref:Uncharacterized protein n=1 Tax=Myxacorys almedinensis A TaxID=2690445 RepID=A0A8J8CL32_9CYAN|nr:hypothetical protein [Myxacorys almedinensis]NDJ19206.1 hypothetical protein [Myxacorys almedinensis A]